MFKNKPLFKIILYNVDDVAFCANIDIDSMMQFVTAVVLYGRSIDTFIHGRWAIICTRHLSIDIDTMVLDEREVYDMFEIFYDMFEIFYI